MEITRNFGGISSSLTSCYPGTPQFQDTFSNAMASCTVIKVWHTGLSWNVRSIFSIMYSKLPVLGISVNLFLTVMEAISKKGSIFDYRRIYLHTYSMVQSCSWAANWFAASQEIPRISRNPKVHYRTHKRPPPVSILGQLNPVHIPTSHLLKIYPNIIHPSTPRSPQWSLSFRFPHLDPIHSNILPP